MCYFVTSWPITWCAGFFLVDSLAKNIGIQLRLGQRGHLPIHRHGSLERGLSHQPGGPVVRRAEQPRGPFPDLQECSQFMKLTHVGASCRWPFLFWRRVAQLVWWGHAGRAPARPRTRQKPTSCAETLTVVRERRPLALECVWGRGS